MSPSTQESSRDGITAIAQPVKRYITGHDLNTGESIYIDAPDLCTAEVPGFGTASRSYATLKLPAELADDQDLKAHLSHSSPTSYTRGTEFLVPSSGLNTQTGQVELGGANVINLDIDPGAVGHMHRTVSLDISTSVMGEVYHELDSGQKVLLKPGSWRGGSHRSAGNYAHMD
ncbi:uncharacterized protein FTJAE_3150 [Fusarium tjaetaba]|uniref:Uncharacterized protein n=1 Tax=Fusarium tjaetaba TaxID=1567544 RepID=A0A8H5S2C7_9HYPO|nr:uncharacterized protein FTJAE_3150 [Fusarium tjaetaba]KAF5643350.1 hypothetical protein FTJAE_3150 [Fusarium tjaetaba]